MSLRVAVVGATGAVGTVMLEKLRERDFPAGEIVPFASERSAGRELEGGLVVHALTEESIQGFDIAIFSAGATTSRAWAPRFAAAGCVVVDNSSAFRRDPEIPLVVSEVNPEALDTHKGIIANPNCATIGVIVPIAPLHKVYGLERMIVSTYQSTSGAGRGGVDELAEQSQKLAAEMEGLSEGLGAGVAPQPQMFAAPIAFNILPQIGSIKDDGSTSEEIKMLVETRKILSLPDVEVITTCVRVPTAVGHGAAVHARFSQPVDFDEIEGILKHAPGVRMSALPNAHEAAGKDACYVGRVRRDPFDPNAISFFTVSDNLRKGAALNAVQIAEILLPG